jgi:uncharacterized protein YkwD
MRYYVDRRMRERVVLALLLGCGLVLAAERPPPPPRRPPPLTIATIEREVITLVNRHRRARRLPPLIADPRIVRQARLHSRAMATGARAFGHDGFTARAEVLRRAMPCRHAGENVALQGGYGGAADTAMDGWLDSPGHRRNIEGPFVTTGVGAVTDGAGILYVTQLFCGR